MLTNLIFILTIFTSFSFIYKSVEKRESKEKIFYIMYASGVVLVLLFLLSLFKIPFLIVGLYIIFLIGVYLLYSDFFILNQIKEFFLKKQKVKPKKPEIKKVFNTSISVKLKEIQDIEKDIVKLTTPEKNILDFLIIFLGIGTIIYIVYIFYLF